MSDALSGAIGVLTIGTGRIGIAPTTTQSDFNPNFIPSSLSLPKSTASTITPFVSTQGVFQFQATLDGESYNVSVPWNFYAQRWYVSVFDQFNVRVLTLPLIGSPDDYDISLTAGYFTTKMVFRASSQSFEVS